MGIQLFDRRYRIVIDDIEITDPTLSVVFNVVRTLKPEPNTCVLDVYNMAPERRNALAMLAGDFNVDIPVSVSLGYKEGTLNQVFLGPIRRVYSLREGASVITRFESGDGEKAATKARVQKTIPKGAPVSQAIQAVADALIAEGVDPGNLDEKISAIRLNGNTTFPSGTVLSGSAWRTMTSLLESSGLSWSIQDGALQILERDQALGGTAIVLSPDSGLIGSPSIDNEGVVSCEALIVPDLYPGRLVELDSEFISGLFRVETVQYSGESAGNSWTASIEAKQL